jgi:hypothetical protein
MVSMAHHYFGLDLIWRRQRIQILHSEFHKTSGWVTIKNGVPQDSILSPLLFFTVHQ